MNLPILLAAGINWHSFFFLLFALIACGMALAVLFTSNIVRMAFYLTVSLGAVSGLFILAGAHFVGAMQLLIYVGGTLVLLIFGVMLTAQEHFLEMKTRGGEWVLAAIVGGSMLAVLLAAAVRIDAWHRPSDEYLTSIENIQVEPDTTSLGAALMGLRVDSLDQQDEQLRRGMSGYFVHFEIISVHLLVVLIGAAYLARAKLSLGGERLPRATTAPVNRRRGLFVTGMLLLMTLLYVASMAFCFFVWATGYKVSMLGFAVPEIWLWLALAITSLFGAFASIALLRWQQWGFYAIAGLALLEAGLVYAAGVDPLAAGLFLLIGIVWAGVLYGILKIGGERSVWAQSE